MTIPPTLSHSPSPRPSEASHEEGGRRRKIRIAILGFGREGQSVLKYLQNRGPTRSKRGKTRKEFRVLPRESAYDRRGSASLDIWILDENPNIKIPRGVKSQCGKNWLTDISRFDVVVRSPGIYYNRPPFKMARKKGVVFTSSTKLFFEYASKITRNIIGVTGSKGKSTVSTLLYTILKKARRPVYLAGNIGSPALDLLARLKKNDWVVLELSSFQLHDLTVSPPIAVVSEMFPEHQDIHDTVEEYYRAKTSITKYQSANDLVFYLRGNTITERIARGGKGKKIAVTPEKFSLFTPEEVKLNGPHQYRNATLAASVARGIGIPAEVVKKTCTAFSGLPHRIEFVRRIPLDYTRGKRGYSGSTREKPDVHQRISVLSLRKSASVVDFYNDSQSTNAYSVIAAARSFPNKNVIIIGGGYDKNVDYAPFKKSLKNSTLKLAVLFGQNKYKIQKGYRAAGIPTKLVPDLKSAVATAYDFACSPKTYNLKPITYAIILSPGTSSFDMFKSYADRGEQFKKIVRGLR